MKGTDLNSRKNKQRDDDTLIYILLILLIALLIGGLGYWWWQRPSEKNYNYEAELGEFKTSPTAEELSKLISGNRQRQKSIKRFLDDQMKGRRLTETEKKEIRPELEKIDKELDKSLQERDLSTLSPQILAQLYQLFYEEGKLLVRLKDKVSVHRNKEELRKQQEFQKKWTISQTEEAEINNRLKIWIKKWYEQAKTEIMPKHGTSLEGKEKVFVPVEINGRPANPNSQADINYFLDENIKDEKIGGVNHLDTTWKKTVADIKKPLRLNFLSYDGFITEKDLKESKEAENTFGLTLSDSFGPWVRKNDRTSAKYYWGGKKDIRIKLKKEMFLNRLGYEEWINKVKEDGSRIYHDINFESMVDTIAHELAHAIVNTIRSEYEGEEKGGHGRLFYDIMEKMEVMIRESDEYEELKKWWFLA